MSANTQHTLPVTPKYRPFRDALHPTGETPPGLPCGSATAHNPWRTTLRSTLHRSLCRTVLPAFIALLSLLPLSMHPAPALAQQTPQKGQAQQAVPMAKAQVLISGKVITVDVADTPQLQSRGLGGRKHLGPLQGMLFVYEKKDRQTFWMRDMVISIDIIWLDNGQVVHIAPNVPPPKPGDPLAKLPTYSPDKAANMVLELAAGRARELGLKVGDKVDFRFDVN